MSTQPPGLVALIDFHDTITSLSDVDFLQWIQQLVLFNHKKIIISGIFRELYHQGRNINMVTLNYMVDTANNIKAQTTGAVANIKPYQPRPHLNLMDHIPDTILSDIATYLQTQELFSNWNNICKKSLRIGMKPESIQHWNIARSLNSKNSQSLAKFEIYPLLSQVKNIKFHEYYAFFERFFQLKTAKDWKRIDTNTQRFFSRAKNCNKISSMQQVVLRCSTGIGGDLEGLEEYRKDLKRLAIVDGNHTIANADLINDVLEDESAGIEEQKIDIIANERDIINMLQAVMPLQKKDEEIANKILQEKIKLFRNQQFIFRDILPNGDTSTFVTSYLTDREIEKITNDVTKEIELKYDSIDHAEELCYNNENKVNNGIEMLEFCDCDIFLDYEQEAFIWDNYLKYSQSRVVNALPNLKSLAFSRYQCVNSHVYENYDQFFALVSQAILNSIGNQLTSLHLCDSIDIWNDKFHFYKTIQSRIINQCEIDQQYAKQYQNEPWYLKNVSTLCLKIQQRDEWDELLDGTATFINEWTFPSLNHLKIICFDVDSENINGDEYQSPLLIENNSNNNQFSWNSLVIKQLESLDLCFSKCAMDDFFTVQDSSVQETDNQHDQYHDQSTLNNSSRIGTYLNALQLKISQNILNVETMKSIRKGKRFILKLHFKIDLSQYLKPAVSLADIVGEMNNDIFVTMKNDLTGLCKLLCQSFDNTMFGFKITFYSHSWLCKLTEGELAMAKFVLLDTIVEHMGSLCDIICESTFFKSVCADNEANSNKGVLQGDGLKFQASVKEYVASNNRFDIVFAMVLNKWGKKTNGNPLNNIDGYCEPRFEYSCNFCETEPWLESKFANQCGCKTVTHRVIG